MMKNVAILLCGGIGKRMNLLFPKQFANLKSKEVWTYCADIFFEHEKIDQILISADKKYHDKISEYLKYKYIKPFSLVDNGIERINSAINAINFLKTTGECNVILTDIVRPFISSETINKCIEMLNVCSVVDVGINPVETIFSIEKNNEVNILDRNSIYLCQGPECFHLSVLQKMVGVIDANSNIVSQNITNITGLVMHLFPQLNITIIRGTQNNIKITTKEDLKYAEFLLSNI